MASSNRKLGGWRVPRSPWPPAAGPRVLPSPPEPRAVGAAGAAGGQRRAVPRAGRAAPAARAPARARTAQVRRLPHLPRHATPHALLHCVPFPPPPIRTRPKQGRPMKRALGSCIQRKLQRVLCACCALDAACRRCLAVGIEAALRLAAGSARAAGVQLPARGSRVLVVTSGPATVGESRAATPSCSALAQVQVRTCRLAGEAFVASAFAAGRHLQWRQRHAGYAPGHAASIAQWRGYEGGLHAPTATTRIRAQPSTGTEQERGKGRGRIASRERRDCSVPLVAARAAQGQGACRFRCWTTWAPRAMGCRARCWTRPGSTWRRWPRWRAPSSCPWT